MLPTELPSSGTAAKSLATFLVVYLTYRFLQRMNNSRSAEAKAQQCRATKQQQMDTQFKAAKIFIAKHLSAEQLKAYPTGDDKVCYLSATEAVENIRAGKLTASVLLSHLMLRLIDLQQNKKMMLISEPNFIQAIADAERLDSLSRQGTCLGSLHGLSVSVKDGCNVTGLDSTLGLCRHVGNPAPEDALVVRLLKQQGALVHTKTNIPQTLLSFECSNPVFGRTTHPMNPELTPGGSSGGEGAALLAGGSLVGLGTDIGGSVRIPAHFSGNSALKPTSRRITFKGWRPSVPGQEAIAACVGPMAQRVDDLILVMKELLVPEAWTQDSDLVPLPLDVKEIQSLSSLDSRKLKIGYYTDDGFCTPSPPCSRAVLDTVDALRKAGHQVTEFKPPSMTKIIEVYFSLISSDGCETIAKQLEGEVWEDYCRYLVTAIQAPAFVRKGVQMMFQYVLDWPHMALLARASGKKTVAEIWALQYLRKGLRQKFFDEWKAQGDFDAIICPAHVLPAVPHQSFKEISFAACYTMAYNVLDLPAGVLPVTFVDKIKDKLPTGYVPPTILEKRCLKYYNLDKQAGLPIGIQVVGLPFKDEKVLAVMKVIEKLVDCVPRPRL